MKKTLKTPLCFQRIRFCFLILSAVLFFLAAYAGGRKQSAARPEIDIAAAQKDLLAKLSGAAEIRPGVKLADRAALENKQEARMYLRELWKSLGLDVQTQSYSAEGENLFAVIGSTTPSDETVVFGAHYDTSRNSPGANDNASGTAVVTAVAYEIGRLRPRSRNFIFVLFDEEERGLKGSKAFAQKLKDENTNVHSVQTIDQMGWDQDGDRAIELEIPYEGAAELYRRASRSLGAPVPILVTQESGSDHSAFRKLGYKAVGITEEYMNNDTTPHIHRPTDLADTIRFEYLKSTTDVAVRVMRILAQKKE